jgi:hypothetical protein
MIKKAILVLLLSTPCMADSINFRSSVGVHNSSKSSMYSLNLQTDLKKDFYYRFDVGFWTDSEKNGNIFSEPKRKWSIFTSFLLGKQFGPNSGFHGNLGVGVAAISSPDSLLSSAFQFTEEVSIGYDQFDVGFKHFSNAGITKPNKGRDYIYLNYRVWL